MSKRRAMPHPGWSLAGGAQEVRSGGLRVKGAQTVRPPGYQLPLEPPPEERPPPKELLRLEELEELEELERVRLGVEWRDVDTWPQWPQRFVTSTSPPRLYVAARRVRVVLSAVT